MSPRVGVTLSGRYRLQRLIATGGMGQVWEAVDSRLGRRVAVKVLKQEFSQDPEFIERFRAEARTTAMLNHPGIAAVHDYGESQLDGEGRTAYLVMELVNGEPLNSVLKRTGRLSLRHALDMLEQTGRALQVAHAAGLVHRDVKPGNILITPTGQVKITDFGIAKAVDAAPVTQTGMVMGTAQYIAPEQALGHDATPSSDVYSLGVVGYEVVSGKRPFTGDGALTVAMKHIKEPPPPLPAELPPNVRELIEITLVKNPAMRYRSGGPFADAVAAVRAGRRPPRPSATPPAGRASPAAIPSSPTTRAAAVSPSRSVPARRSSRPATAGHRPPPARRTFSSGQRALLWAAGVLGALAIIIAVLIVINSRADSEQPSPPPTVTDTGGPPASGPPPASKTPSGIGPRLDWTDGGAIRNSGLQSGQAESGPVDAASRDAPGPGDRPLAGESRAVGAGWGVRLTSSTPLARHETPQ
jgi:eukaryotic-like serine/threonine-protein kinase